MYEKEDAYRDKCLQLVKNGNNNEPLTYLFNTYFRLTLIHLVKRFRNVRREVLEDIAIESVEYWYFEKLHDDYWSRLTLFAIERRAKERVFNIINAPRSKKDRIDDSLINYLDELAHYEITDADRTTDLAKLTFELRSKADKYIGQLSDEDYKIITMYLDGRNSGYIAKQLNITRGNQGSRIRTAFKRLKMLIFGNPKFEKGKEIYREKKHLCTFPEMMEMYYEKEMKQSEISNKLLIGVRVIEDRLRRQKKKLGII